MPKELCSSQKWLKGVEGVSEDGALRTERTVNVKSKDIKIKNYEDLVSIDHIVALNDLLNAGCGSIQYSTCCSLAWKTSCILAIGVNSEKSKQTTMS